MRLACLYVPDFPVAALLRAEPELRGQPAVVSSGAGARALVRSVSPEATRLGIAAGLTVTQARAVDADLVVRAQSEARERAAQAALGDVADSFSPRVENAGDGVVYLDADGLSALFSSENALVNAMAQRAVSLGLEAHVGLASSKVAAYLAARDGGGARVIPPGEEWRFLGPMSVSLLQPSPELTATLRRWGILTVGALAALPASAVATRLGPEGLALVRRARGDDEYPLMPRPAPLRFEETAELDYGIETLEPFAFIARGLLERLTARIALRGFVCGDLHLSLGLAGRGHDERTVPVAAASNDVKSLLALLRLHLETYPPAAAVESIRLSAVSERLRPSQLNLFRSAGPAPEQLAVTLARLTAICGADRVGRPVVPDSHRIDAYSIAPFAREDEVLGVEVLGVGERQGPLTANTSTPNTSSSPPNTLSFLAVRAIRPPRPLIVFRDRGRLDFVRGEGLCGRVVSAAGPWRVQSDWWNEQASARDYYDVQLSDGAVYRLYCEPQTQTWFADGIYD